MSTDEPAPTRVPGSRAYDDAYENAHARLEREIAERARTERLLLAVADALDAFDRVLEGERTADPESYRRSVRLIAGQLESVALDAGLEPVGRIGERADPASHHVVGTRRRIPLSTDGTDSTQSTDAPDSTGGTERAENTANTANTDDTDDDHDTAGEVIEVLGRGFRYRGRLLRPARVVIAVSGAAEEDREHG